jgi:hypothetical protein
MKAIVERDLLLEKVIHLRMGQFERHKAEQAQQLGALKGADQ